MNSAFGANLARLLIVFACFIGGGFSHVVEESVDNFDQLIHDHNLVLVNFYETWCENCPQFDPHFSRLSQLLAEDHPGIKVVKMDTEADLSFIEMLRIKVYPQIMLFVNKLPVPYRDALDVDHIRSWVNVTLRKKPLLLSNNEQLITLNYPIFYFFSGDQSSSLFQLIDNIAKRTYDSLIFFSSNTSLQHELGIYDTETLSAVYRQGNLDPLTYNGDYTVFNTFNFLLTSKQPISQKLDLDLLKSILGKGSPCLLIFGNQHEIENVRKDVTVDWFY